MKSLKVSVLLIVPLFAGPVFALDADLYTYNGFNETVMSLQRLALIFNDGNYASLFFVACVLGIVLGGSVFFGRQALGGYQDHTSFSMAWLYSLVAGVVIYQATIVPKGTLYVYDPVRNNFQTVGNIPDLVVLISAILNKVERLTVELVDSTSAFPYANEAGGISFNLLYAATTDNNSIDDYYLFKSIKEYYKQCSPVALSSNAYSFNLNDLRTNTNNIAVMLQELRSPSAFTSVYSTANKSGVAKSCEDAWVDDLQPAIFAQSTYTQLLTTVCGKAGFNVSAVAELTRCQGRITALNTTVYDYAAGDAYHLLRSATMANAISQALQDENPDIGVRALTNRAMMTEGIGSAMATDSWMSKARAVLFGVVIGITPLLFCFVVTPLVWKALHVYCGLFVWLSLWGVSDVITHGMAMDYAQQALLELKRNHMGITSMFLSPDASLQALATIGKIRAQGVMIASVISAGLFAFSAYSLSGIASAWTQTMDREGSEAANRNTTPEGRAGTLSGQQNAVSAAATMQQFGFDRLAQSQTMGSGRESASNLALADTMGSHGFDLRDSINAAGQNAGGGQAGTLLGAMQYASTQMGSQGRSMQEIAANQSRFNQLVGMGRTGGDERATNQLGISPDQLSDFRAYWDTLQGASSTMSLSGLKERVENNSGKTFSDAQFAKLVADYNVASLGGNMEGSKLNPETLERLYAQNMTMDIGTANGIAAVAAVTGNSIDSLGRAVGVFRGTDAAAQIDTLKDYNVNELVTASYANHARFASSGLAVDQVSKEYAGGMRTFQDRVAEANTAQDFGRVLVFENVARTIDEDMVSASVAQNSVGVQVAISPDQVEQYTGKLFDQQTADFFKANGGGVYSLSFDPTKEGTVLTARAASGDSKIVDDSIFINKSLGVEAGVPIRTESTIAMFQDDEYKDVGMQVLKEAGAGTQARETLANNVANWLSMYATETYSEQMSTDSRGSVSGGIHVSTPQSLPVGVSAGGDVTHSNSRSESDLQSVNPMFSAAKILINQSESHAISAAEEYVALEEQRRFKDSGEHLSTGERRELYESAKYDLWYEGIQSKLHVAQDQFAKTNNRLSAESTVVNETEAISDGKR